MFAMSFDHVFGDARLRDFKPELQQFTMDTRRAPKRIFDTHLPDQRAQLRFDLRPPSQWPRSPTPVAAKARPMPAHQRLGTDDRKNLQDRRTPSIQLDKEPAIIVCEPDATTQPTCACRKSNSDILVMQPAENGVAKNTPCPLNGARDRRILLQR